MISGSTLARKTRLVNAAQRSERMLPAGAQALFPLIFKDMQDLHFFRV